MPMRSRGRQLGLVALVLSIPTLTAGLLVSNADPEKAPAGSAVPAGKRRTPPELKGAVLVPPPVRLVELRGKPIVINFWASWCVPCRKEAPELARFDRELGARAQLIGVDFQDTKSEALAFVREFHWRFPNRRDPRGKLAGRYGLIGLPTTFIIDGQGRIGRQLTGAQTYAKLARAVEAVD